jgi:hypothetical protein
MIKKMKYLMALSLPHSSCSIQVRDDFMAISNFLLASSVAAPYSVTSFNSSRLNSAVKIRGGMRFIDSPNKLIKLHQLVRPPKWPSLTRS